MKQSAKALWKLCFDDSDAFIDFYFERLYTDTRHVALQRDGCDVAAMQLLPFPMQYQGEILPTAYMSGVCTHPDYRNQGLMNELMQVALKKLYMQGVRAATLIPANKWLFDIYAKSGFYTVFTYSTEIYQPKTLQKTALNIVPYDKKHKSQTYDLLHKHNLARGNGLIITETYFDIIIESFQIDHSPILLCFDQQMLQGIIFGTEHGQILELIYDTNEVKDALLNAFSIQTKNSELTILIPPFKGTDIPLGMLRIVDAEQFLIQYAATYPDEKITINLIDKILTENSGTYQLQEGFCTKLPLDEKSETITPNALAKFLFKDSTAYMSLMLNK